LLSPVFFWVPASWLIVCQSGRILSSLSPKRLIPVIQAQMPTYVWLWLFCTLGPFITSLISAQYLNQGGLMTNTLAYFLPIFSILLDALAIGAVAVEHSGELGAESGAISEDEDFGEDESILQARRLESEQGAQAAAQYLLNELDPSKESIETLEAAMPILARGEKHQAALKISETLIAFGLQHDETNLSLRTATWSCQQYPESPPCLFQHMDQLCQLAQKKSRHDLFIALARLMYIHFPQHENSRSLALDAADSLIERYARAKEAGELLKQLAGDELNSEQLSRLQTLMQRRKALMNRAAQ